MQQIRINTERGFAALVFRNGYLVGFGISNQFCAAAEIHVQTNNAEQHAKIRGNLRYSREAGKRTCAFGRCLVSVEGLEFTPLQVGDRLKPTQ